MTKKLSLTKISKISLYVGLIVTYSCLLLKCQDSDMFQMIATGRQILSTGNLTTNAYTITNTSCIFQQWLYCVLLAIVDNFGYVGHILFVLVQDIVLLYLIKTYLDMKNIHNSTLWGLAIIVLCFVFMIKIRPQIVTICLMIYQLICLERAENNKRWLLSIIPIIILEANLHMSMLPMHLFVAIPYLVKRRRYILYVLSMIPLSLLNPYGVDGLLYTVKALTDDTFVYANVSEVMSFLDMMKFDWRTAAYVAIIIAVILCLLAIAIACKTITAQSAFYSIVIVIAILMSIRNISFAPFALMILAPNIAFNDKIVNISMIGIMCTMSIMSIASVFATTTFNFLEKDSRYCPVSIIDTIEDKNAKIFTSFNSGGYFEYMGYSNMFIDARPELYIDNGTLRDYSVLVNGFDAVTGESLALRDAYEIISKYDFEYICADNDAYIYDICRLLGYTKLASNDYFTIYEVN